MPSTTSHRLILFHGLSSSPQEFGLIAHGLKARGLDYRAVSVPQYTLGQLSGAPAWRRWVEQARTVVGEASADGTPVVLGGLCVGGMLAAALAAGPVPNVAGLIMMSPTFAYDGWGVSITRHLRHVAYATGLSAHFHMREREPYGIKNPKIRHWIKRELSQRAHSAAGPARISLNYLRESERMTSHVRKCLPTLTCPIMMMHARSDEITRLSSVSKVFAQLAATKKELVVLNDSYHMVTIDNDRSRVVSAIDRFIRVNVAVEVDARASKPPKPAARHPFEERGVIAA